MDKLVFSCFLLGGLTPDPGPTDSCALNAYCAAGVTNVGCNPPPATGGPACSGNDPVVLELLEAEQTTILSFFNQQRNLFSLGVYRTAKANRMFVLQWDASLATQAGHNARSCNVTRDACRNTADFRNVGQMIVDFYGPIGSLLGMPIERKVYNTLASNIAFVSYMTGTASLSSYSASTNTENQANILNDRSIKVGCALMQWDYDGTLHLYMVCNFSDNVIEGQPLYTSAASAGMGCATKDTTYTGLCLT